MDSLDEYSTKRIGRRVARRDHTSDEVARLIPHDVGCLTVAK